MKDLIIFGTGGFAAEAADYIKKHDNLTAKFLDDVDEHDLRSDIKQDYIGGIQDYKKNKNAMFFIGIGDPKGRKELFEQLDKDLNFYTFVHPTAQVSESASISSGSFLYPFSILANNAEVGSHCVINSYSAVGHDAKLGNFATLSAQVDITGNVEVGECSFFGSGSRVVPGVKIAKNTRVGAGVVVLRNSSESDILMPNVAKKIKSRK